MMKVLCTSSIIYIAQDHHLGMVLTEPASIDPPFSHRLICSVVTPAFLTACTIRFYSVLGGIQLKYTLKSNHSFLHCKFWLPPEKHYPKILGCRNRCKTVRSRKRRDPPGGFQAQKVRAIADNNLLIFETE